MPGTTDPQGVPIDQEAGGTRQYVITPNDSADLPVVVRAMRVNVAGDVSFIAFGDTEPVTWADCQIGDIIPMFTRRVMATGTDATVIGLY